ncbi:glutathione S-transferase family protein [Evansella cellulosilytica]|uniref:Glutathione transferase n=1 Tax=Evansella cellulosilytica (strain ATCC 21833 / DSM 2522 / FERM P-1141 / JCM 9156 / N-4) TaxID=649639 RepID=E6TZB5_EVAC2|nr:glutathione S-transferase C-terminal domain-containing protein [Evansella cellulosilytica]ADU28977.1 Glutathione transferase [Evansella cellulosilytica DSM 2522]
MEKSNDVSCAINSPKIQKDSLVNKPKEISEDGTFKRQTNRFTTPFGEGEGELPIEEGRYRLLWSQACPWAHRAVIVRKILGLEEVISLGTASPMRPKIDRVDWEFSLDKGDRDPVLDIQYVSEVYVNADQNYSGRPTVPVMVDVKTKKAVNNDYFKLTNYFETVWQRYHKHGAPDLYPKNLRSDIDAMNDSIFHNVNNAVYQCGFAHSQEAYEESFNRLFAKLEELEQHLSTNRFLFGDYITDSDVRLYTTLVRFDVAYYNGFNTNLKLIKEYPNLWGYVRDLYDTPGFGDTTDFDAIKRHYHLSITINPDKTEVSILPKGPDLSVWDLPHEREKLSEKEEKFIVRS